MAHVRPEPGAGVASVLVVAGPAHGDVLLATPLFSSLKRAYPDAVIDALVYRGQAGILQGNPEIDDVISVSKHPGLREYVWLLRRLRRRYDVAMSTKYTDRAILYAFLAGRRRIAIVPAERDAWKRWVVQSPVTYDHYDTHTIVQNNRLGQALGIPVGTEVRLPHAADAAAVLTRLLPSNVAGKLFAVLHLNPGVPYKRWTLEGWGAVATFLDARGFAIVLTGDGSTNEMHYLEAAMRLMPGTPINLAGKLRFADVAELLRQCTLYVGADTVTSHIAAAAGAPTIALFGPESPRVWGPWPKGYAAPESPFAASGSQRVGNVRVLQSAVPCPTCRQGHCLRRSEKARSCQLMLSLDSGQVIDELTRTIHE